MVKNPPSNSPWGCNRQCWSQCRSDPPGLGAKIPHAVWQDQKFKKEINKTWWEQEKEVQLARYKRDQETSFDFCNQAAWTLLRLHLHLAHGCISGFVFTASDRHVRWACCGHQVWLSCLWAPPLFSEQEEPDSATCSLGGSPGAGVKFRLSPAPKGLYSWELKAVWNGTRSVSPRPHWRQLPTVISL